MSAVTKINTIIRVGKIKYANNPAPKATKYRANPFLRQRIPIPPSYSVSITDYAGRRKQVSIL